MLGSGSLSAAKAEDMSKKTSVLGEARRRPHSALSIAPLTALHRTALQGCGAAPRTGLSICHKHRHSRI